MKIVARVIIEILGAPKEHVENTMKMVVEELEKREEVKILKKEFAEAETVKDEKLKNFWSSFVEVDLESEDIESLIGICFDFLPSSIEIIEPSDFRLNSRQVDDVLNDLLEKLHKFSMAVRNMHAENVLLKKKLDGEIKE